MVTMSGFADRNLKKSEMSDAGLEKLTSIVIPNVPRVGASGGGEVSKGQYVQLGQRSTTVGLVASHDPVIR